jgi:hypothetical protein
MRQAGRFEGFSLARGQVPYGRRLGAYGLTDSALVQDWLVAWRERGPAPVAQREAHKRQGVSRALPTVSATAASLLSIRVKPNSYGFIEPNPWPCDECNRRELVPDTYRSLRSVVWMVG